MIIVDDVTTVFRLALSVLLGGIIGFERQHRGKSAGLRTHTLVSLGSCLVAVLSINVYATVEGHTNADPARLAAQVISGIGFLGAGAIMKEGVNIKGLTTAASLWVVASVGLAVGFGALVGAIATTVLVMGVLEIVPLINKYSAKSLPLAVTLSILSEDYSGQIGRIGSCLGDLGIKIIQIQIEDAENGKVMIPVTIELQDKQKIEKILAELAKINGVISIEQEAH